MGRIIYVGDEQELKHKQELTQTNIIQKLQANIWFTCCGNKAQRLEEAVCKKLGDFHTDVLVYHLQTDLTKQDGTVSLNKKMKRNKNNPTHHNTTHVSDRLLNILIQ